MTSIFAKLKILLVGAPTADTVLTGTLERVGPWMGPYEATGTILLLRGDPTLYLVLRDSSSCLTPIGLAQAGDEVTFKVEDLADGLVKPAHSKVVGLASFTNHTLDRIRGRQPGARE